MKRPIGERIRDRRELLNMSQDELAARIGYKSRSSINKIESGQNDLPQSKVRKIAAALGVTPGYIMGWEDESGSSIDETESEEEEITEIDMSEFGLTKAEKMVIRAYRAYPFMQDAVNFLLGVVEETTWANGGSPEDAKKAINGVDFQKLELIARYKFHY